MKRLKDTKITYKVKIDIIQKHIKDKDVHSNIPFMIRCEVDNGHIISSTCFNYNKKGKNELIKFLRKECFI